MNLTDDLKEYVNDFNYNEELKQGFEMANEYDIYSFDTRCSSRQHQLPNSSKVHHCDVVCWT